MSELKTILLHLTDLHFGDIQSKSLSVPNFSYNDISKLISNTIKNEYTSKKIIIALGGDITNKGESKKYQHAISFLNLMKSELLNYQIDFILCPGNHDIETGKNNLFESFNIFSGELTKTDKYIFSDSVTSVLFEKHNWSFVVTNSLYHGDHKFGLIDIDELEKKLINAKKPVILLTHHHLIPILKDDISTIRNSYDFLRICKQYKVKLILHGHIHSSFKMEIVNENNNIIIVGCGATLPEISTNYNNQFNIIELKNKDNFDITSYRIIYDSITSHKPQTIKIKI
jgi:3',5'-cyclic AMP phosphodiesterase CpdA